MQSMLSLLTKQEQVECGHMPTQRCAALIADAAIDAGAHRTDTFRRAIGYLGSWTAKPGEDSPSKLTPELHKRLSQLKGFPKSIWGRMGKVEENFGPPRGYFRVYALGLMHVPANVFGELVEALRARNPDKPLARLLARHDGHLPGMGLASFSQTAQIFRPDLYCALNAQSWVEAFDDVVYSDEYTGFPVLCRSLRALCDKHGFPTESRFVYFDWAVIRGQDKKTLLEKVNRLLLSHLKKDGLK